MKKLLFTFLAAMCCTVMALAANTNAKTIEYEPGKIMYFILDETNHTATVTYGNGMFTGTTEYAGSITIPSTVRYDSKDYTVTSVGDFAFSNCDPLTSVTIPEGVESIGQNAFSQCTKMTSVTIPEGVTGIGERAFYSCSSMTSVIIPSSVTSIGKLAFGICERLTLMFQGDKPGSLADDLFQYQWFDNLHITLPKIFVCDKYEDKYTDFFGAKGHTIVSLSKFKTQVLNEIKGKIEVLKEAGNLPELVEAIIESRCSDIESATTPGDVFTINKIALQTINLSPQMQAAIAELNNLVENKVGLDIRRYITDICNATSKEQITEILNNATEEILNSKTFTVGDKMYYLNHIGPDYTFYGDVTFNDKDLYQSDYDFTVTGTDSITYNRTFTNTNWQALYVPFAISCSDWGDDFDVAAINNFHEYTDEMGQTYKTELEIRMVKSGTLKPNHPYLIKAHDAPEPLQIELTTKKISKSDENRYSCSSMESQYTFTGTYQEMNKLKTNDYIFMSGGKLCKAENDEVVLLPQRWYLKITSLGSQVDGGNTSYGKAKEFDIKLLDDEPTGIDEITVTRTPLRNSVEAIYNLNGMRVNDSYKGIVIKNGKKVYQR